MEESKKLFEMSFDNFAKINHLSGMYLSKKHLKEVMSLLHVEEEDIDLTEYEAQVMQHQKRFYFYVQEFGLE